MKLASDFPVSIYEVTDWQQTACSILKVAYLIKSIEEDSQDINDYAQLGLFLQMQGQSLYDLYNYEWHKPQHLPESEVAQRAFVKISTFFLKLKESVNVGEAVPEGVAADLFADTSGARGGVDGFADDRLVQVVASDDSGTRVDSPF